MSRNKELKFFNGDNWERGLDWYKSNFEGGQASVRGEATPGYTIYPMGPLAPERMRSVVPDAKLIYLVRDPIERIVSAYVGRYAGGRESRPFEEAIRPSLENFDVCVSSYAMQLERYLAYFPRDQILVVEQEELLRRRRETLRTVFRFLGVDESFDSRRFDRIRNPTSAKHRVGRHPFWLSGDPVPRRPGGSIVPWEVRLQAKRMLYRPFSAAVERPRVSEQLRQGLREVLEPDVQRLRRLTGKPLAQWSI
jgi:hypothetical protein